MKHPKSKFTANQLDQALVEEIELKRKMRFPVNAISSAAMFCDMVIQRLCGPREMSKRSAVFQETFTRLIEDAKVERAEYTMKERQQRVDNQRRIIVPGQSNPGRN